MPPLGHVKAHPIAPDNQGERSSSLLLFLLSICVRGCPWSSIFDSVGRNQWLAVRMALMSRKLKAALEFSHQASAHRQSWQLAYGSSHNTTACAEVWASPPRNQRKNHKDLPRAILVQQTQALAARLSFVNASFGRQIAVPAQQHVRIRQPCIASAVGAGILLHRVLNIRSPYRIRLGPFVPMMPAFQ